METAFLISLIGWISLGLLITIASVKSIQYLTSSWDTPGDRITALVAYVGLNIAFFIFGAMFTADTTFTYSMLLQVFFSVQALFVILVAALRRG
jgi:hypothetical protein